MSVISELITEWIMGNHGETVQSELKEQPADYTEENFYLHANIFVISRHRKRNT